MCVCVLERKCVYVRVCVRERRVRVSKREWLMQKGVKDILD